MGMGDEAQRSCPASRAPPRRSSEARKLISWVDLSKKNLSVEIEICEALQK